MEPVRRPRLKVCCIQSPFEARLAVRLGASALGLVSEMPSGPGVIPEETIAAIARAVPPPVASFLLTSRRDAAGMAGQQRRNAVEEAVAVAAAVDAILLDSGNPSLAVKELGGTGRRHDWRLSRRIREAVPVPVFLAGGLRAENVEEAIAEVAPFALDVCSGVRTDGRLDEEKLTRFVAAMSA